MKEREREKEREQEYVRVKDNFKKKEKIFFYIKKTESDT